MKLKVFSGLIKVKGVQRPTIVATSSQKRAAALLGRSVKTLQDYWITSDDAHEIAVATASPETVFRTSGIRHTDFKPVVPPIATDSTIYADGLSDSQANHPSIPLDKSAFGQECQNGYKAAEIAENK